MYMMTILLLRKLHIPSLPKVFQFFCSHLFREANLSQLILCILFSEWQYKEGHDNVFLRWCPVEQRMIGFLNVVYQIVSSHLDVEESLVYRTHC